MNFDQSKLAGSKNIILNTCGETCNVVSKAHWRRDNIISLRNQNHFGANTNGLSFLLKQFIKCQYWTNETVRFFWIYKGATFNEETHQKNALKLRINLGNALYPRYFNFTMKSYDVTVWFHYITNGGLLCFRSRVSPEPVRQRRELSGWKQHWAPKMDFQMRMSTRVYWKTVPQYVTYHGYQAFLRILEFGLPLYFQKRLITDKYQTDSTRRP